MKGKFQSQYVCSVGMNIGGISKPAGTDPLAEDRDLNLDLLSMFHFYIGQTWKKQEIFSMFYIVI